MKFTLEVSMNNAAFADDPRYELARILRGLAVDFDPGGDLEIDPPDEWPVHDSNGNGVGRWEITEADVP